MNRLFFSSSSIDDQTPWVEALCEAYEPEMLVGPPWPEYPCLGYILSLLQDRVCLLGNRSTDCVHDHELEIQFPIPLFMRVSTIPWKPMIEVRYVSKNSHSAPYLAQVIPFKSELRNQFILQDGITLEELLAALRYLNILAELAGYLSTQRLAWWRFALYREETFLSVNEFFPEPDTKIMIPAMDLGFPELQQQFKAAYEVRGFIDLLGKPVLCRATGLSYLRHKEEMLRKAVLRSGYQHLVDLLSLPSSDALLEVQQNFQTSAHTLH